MILPEKEEVVFIPRKENFITVVNIENGKVASFNYVETTDQLMKVF